MELPARPSDQAKAEEGTAAHMMDATPMDQAILNRATRAAYQAIGTILAVVSHLAEAQATERAPNLIRNAATCCLISSRYSQARAGARVRRRRFPSWYSGCASRSRGRGE